MSRRVGLLTPWLVGAPVRGRWKSGLPSGKGLGEARRLRGGQSGQSPGLPPWLMLSLLLTAHVRPVTGLDSSVTTFPESKRRGQLLFSWTDLDAVTTVWAELGRGIMCAPNLSWSFQDPLSANPSAPAALFSLRQDERSSHEPGETGQTAGTSVYRWKRNTGSERKVVQRIDTADDKNFSSLQKLGQAVSLELKSILSQCGADSGTSFRRCWSSPATCGWTSTLAPGEEEEEGGPGLVENFHESTACECWVMGPPFPTRLAASLHPKRLGAVNLCSWAGQAGPREKFQAVAAQLRPLCRHCGAWCP
ncbi:hypothetical protein HPG69_012508 [Diceros bicornis minor]|uniref:Uncharacterized protein n=1 Tax=Diceros bicornis minor TaxID=77932 RepID=A0A7J7F093_DICBM|nr:hypothetical protein HPG69_012508 [Diceros bicornis minor]